MLQDPPRFLLQCKPGANMGGTASDEICGVQTHAEHSWERTWFNALERFNFSHYFKQRSINRKFRNFQRVQGTSLFSFSLPLLFHFKHNYSLWFRLKFLSLPSPFLLPRRKGVDPSGASLPALCHPLDQVKGPSMTSVWRKAALCTTAIACHKWQQLRFPEAGQQEQRDCNLQGQEHIFACSHWGKLWLTMKMCQRDRSPFPTEYTHPRVIFWGVAVFLLVEMKDSPNCLFLWSQSKAQKLFGHIKADPYSRSHNFKPGKTAEAPKWSRNSWPVWIPFLGPIRTCTKVKDPGHHKRHYSKCHCSDHCPPRAASQSGASRQGGEDLCRGREYCCCLLLPLN